jgi:hypothetical protein
VDRLPANVEPNAHSGIVMNGANAFFKVPENNGQPLPPQTRRAISLRPLTALQRFFRLEIKEQ